MPRHGKYPDEMGERAVRTVLDHGHEYGSQWEAICSVADEFATLSYVDWFNRRRLHGEITDSRVRSGMARSEQACDAPRPAERLERWGRHQPHPATSTAQAVTPNLRASMKPGAVHVAPVHAEGHGPLTARRRLPS